LSSNPLDANPLRLDKEMRDIETELIRSKHRDLFEFIKFSAVRIKDLQDALLNHTPNFVHFSGHGNSNGIALLDNQTEKVQIVQSEPLSNLFKLFSNDIACVFLNSCYSKEQAVMIRKYIPNVIGMNKAVPDNTAIEFATVFYKGIAAGREIGFSFELAKNSVDLHNIPGSDIPEII
jgi:CHAT domain